MNTKNQQKNIKNGFPSRINFFFLILLSLCFLSFLLLSLATFFFYQNTKEIKTSSYNQKISHVRKNVLKAAEDYNRHLAQLYENMETIAFFEVMAKLDQLGDDPYKMDPEAIDRIAQESGVNITLVEAETTKVISTNIKFNMGVCIKEKYPDSLPIIESLKPGIPHFRHSWVPGCKRFLFFGRKLSQNKKFYWNLGLGFVRNFEFDDDITFLKKVKDHQPTLKQIAVLSSTMDELQSQPESVMPLKFEDRDQSKECSKNPGCPEWIELTPSKAIPKDQSIRYIGISFDNKPLRDRLALLMKDFYQLILISLALSLLLSLLLTLFLNQKLKKYLEIIRKLNKNIYKKETLPSFWVTEMNEVSSSFNSLIEKLRQKREETKKLATDILFIADKERQGISRDLHDTVGQLLTAADMELSGKNIPRAKDLILSASNELRNLYEELEPRHIEKSSLQESSDWYRLKFFPEDFPCHINVEEAKSLPLSIRRQLFNIIQEGIANCKKHAPKSEYLEIELSRLGSTYTMKIINESENPKKREGLEAGRGLKNIQLRTEALGGICSIRKLSKTFEIKIEFTYSENKEI